MHHLGVQHGEESQQQVEPGQAGGGEFEISDGSVKQVGSMSAVMCNET